MSSFIKLKHVQNMFATENFDEMIVKREGDWDYDGFGSIKM